MNHFLISRTDSIGDVILTLPVAGALKEKFPDCRVSFLGRTYTKDVIALSSYVDEFLNWDEISVNPKKKIIQFFKEQNIDWFLHIFPNKQLAGIAKKAGIKNRVGTSHRIYHWTTCNKPVSFTRRKSDLHEAQLNFHLLSPLEIAIPERNHLHNYYGFRVDPSLQQSVKGFLKPGKKNIILHPKSKGSAREWGIRNFNKLVNMLPEDQYHVFISGTKDEAARMQELLGNLPDHASDITGKFSLAEFIAFISVADGIVAASTGPLHIAAALNGAAVGIYPPIRPMHPGRWAPLGKNTHVLCKDISCEKCRKTMHCTCMEEIRPEEVKAVLDSI